MADDKLRDEYERLLASLDGGYSERSDQIAAIVHILKRLGPPDPLDGVEPEKLTEREV